MKATVLWVSVAALLCWQYGRAEDEAYLAYGVGVFHDADAFAGQNKYFNAGYRRGLWRGFYWNTKLGYYGEGSPDPTRKSSFFTSTGPGLELSLGALEIRSGWGIAAISTTDSQLGGRFPQFNGNAAIGIRDSKGDGLAIEYNHISSAGLVSPNQGRDFILLELSEKWY